MPPESVVDELEDLPVVRFTGREWRSIKLRATLAGYTPEEWCRSIVLAAAVLVVRSP